MRIAAIETRRYAVPWDPPLHVAWDPVPRTGQEATIVIVRSDDGLEGYASGDALPDRALLERFLVGVDPLRTEIVRELCETVDFHHGRPWTAEVAVWDLAGRALGIPCWALLGGRSERLLAYASSCERVDLDERVRRCVALRDAGVRAVKLRFFREDWREDVARSQRGPRSPGMRQPWLASIMISKSGPTASRTAAAIATSSRQSSR